MPSSEIMVQAPIVVTPTPAQNAALKAYVLGRYRRIKATVDHDREVARTYMSTELWDAYRSRLHPETAISQFKQCADCDEFDIAVLDMRSFALVTEDGSKAYMTTVFVRTQPVDPSRQSTNNMEIRLVWTPASGVHGRGVVIVIDGDEAHGNGSQIPQGDDDTGGQLVHSVPDPSTSAH